MFSKYAVAANPQYTLKPNLDQASKFAETVLYQKLSLSSDAERLCKRLYLIEQSLIFQIDKFHASFCPLLLIKYVLFSISKNTLSLHNFEQIWSQLFLAWIYISCCFFPLCGIHLVDLDMRNSNQKFLYFR